MATLTKWSPFSELDWIDRRLGRAFGGFPFGLSLFPAADAYETKDEFVLELEVPGFEEKELGIEVFDHTLLVKGERTETKKEEEKVFTLHERLEREFERRFILPADVDTEHVKASFDKGVLHIQAPKHALSKPYTIQISKN